MNIETGEENPDTTVLTIPKKNNNSMSRNCETTGVEGRLKDNKSDLLKLTNRKLSD